MAASKVISNALSFIPQGYLFGLTMSTAGASTTMSIAAGIAADSTGVRLMKLASAISKTTAAWAAGTAAGGLDTGTIANSTWYHFFEILNVATGAVDVVFSATATPASGPTTMPSGYTLFRRIGSGKTNGSAQWILFSQLGDEFLWSASVTDVHSTTQSTTAVLHTLSVPTGVKVIACFSAQYDKVATPPSTAIYFSSPDQSDEAVGVQLGVTSITMFMQGGTEGVTGGEFRKRTNTSAQIRARASIAIGSMDLATTGWIDDRGRNA
jgi:hypothetical protein